MAEMIKYQRGLKSTETDRTPNPHGQLLWLNPLSPKSDEHQISPCNNYLLSMLCKTERITDMITQDEFA